MSFSEVMLRVLPPVNGKQPHITGHYGEQRASGAHGGTDFNYIGGQSGINLQYPTVYAPIAGEVTFTGGSYGTIKIKDAEGNSHEILHTSSHTVNVGDTVAAGDEIGAMGGQGPSGAAQYPRHVHYQMKGPTGTLISPEIWWDGQVAGAADTAPSPAQATTPALSFQYPIRKADGKQFSDADEIYSVLEGENSGHYLLGSNRFWHGGIHISDKSAPQCVLNEPVRCIADGEVVAYRLNQDYLQSTFGDDEKKLKYSNSFCLVRHEYKSAPNPEEGPNKGKQNKLTFYSLYMHLLPFERYPLAPEEPPKPVVTMTVGDFNGYDNPKWVEGKRLYGMIKQGTRLEVLEQSSQGNLVYAKGKILAGEVKQGSQKTRNVGDEIWFAYQENGAPYRNSRNKEIWKADKIVERIHPNYWQGKVRATAINRLDLYADPSTPANGQPAGARLSTVQLIPGTVVEFDSKEVLNLTVAGVTRRMAKCTRVNSSDEVAGAGVAPASFWACVENEPNHRILNWTSLTPTRFDSVESASIGIKAGDPIGYLGLTENLTGEEGGVTSKYQVHVEVFTAEAEVKDFLKNIAGLKIGKQYLHLVAGKELKKKLPATGTVPLKKTHAVDLAKVAVIKEGNDDFYDVSVIEDGQAVVGLFKKSDASIITQHDWEKLGFQIVEESNATADGFLDPEDMPPFFKELFAKIDTNHDGEVDPNELAEALKNIETRDQWTKLIAYHPTEWKEKADSAKWSKLNSLLEASPKTLMHEKERISRYVFWEELTGRGAMSSDVVWHFHPIQFVENIGCHAESVVCAKCGKNISLTFNIMKKIAPSGVTDEFISEFILHSNRVFPKYGVNTCSQVVHLLGQGKHETQQFTAFRESLIYSRRSYTAERLYRMAPTAINNGFARLGMNLTREEKISYVDQHLIANDAGYGKHCFGESQYPNNDYRGRGLLHLTHYSNYLACAKDIGIHIDANPTLVESDMKIIIETGLWYWKANSIGVIADNNTLAMPAKVRAVTAKINTGLKALEERVTFTNAISAIFKAEFGSCAE
ncbi:peptidoglycan DD-metalloendopeptidase family protein [Pseudomonas sp. SDO528_S397]